MPLWWPEALKALHPLTGESANESANESAGERVPAPLHHASSANKALDDKDRHQSLSQLVPREVSEEDAMRVGEVASGNVHQSSAAVPFDVPGACT